jgi:hypothetical protein
MTRDEAREEIAKFINCGWSDVEIVSALPVWNVGPEGAGGTFGQLVLLVGVIRDLMTERAEA